MPEPGGGRHSSHTAWRGGPFCLSWPVSRLPAPFSFLWSMGRKTGAGVMAGKEVRLWEGPNIWAGTPPPVPSTGVKVLSLGREGATQIAWGALTGPLWAACVYSGSRSLCDLTGTHGRAQPWDAKACGDLEVRGKWLESTGFSDQHQQRPNGTRLTSVNGEPRLRPGHRPEIHADWTPARTVGWCVGLRLPPSSAGQRSPCCHLGEEQTGTWGGQHRDYLLQAGHLPGETLYTEMANWPRL